MLLIQVTYTMRRDSGMPLSAKSGESGILDAIRGRRAVWATPTPARGGGRNPAAHREVDRSPAQKAHLETPHMKQMAAFKPEYVADTKLISCTIPD